jgi:hypothetical protein
MNFFDAGGSRSFFTCAALALVSTVAACSTAPEDVGGGEANVTKARTLKVVKGREYARCWFDVAGQNATLSCTSTARGDDPLGVTVEVVATAMVPNTPGAVGGLQFTSLSKKLNVEAGETVVVGSLPLTAFPLMSFDLHAELTRDALTAIGETKVPGYYNHVRVARPTDLSKANPAIIKQAYDLWPMAFIDARGDWSTYAVSADYTHPIAPYVGFLNEKEMVLERNFVARDTKGQVVWFVAPEGGKLDLRLQAAAKTAVTVTGPGYYVSTEDDFRLATPEEIAIDFEDDTTTNQAGTTTPPGTTEPPPDTTKAPESVDATPGCGGPNESKCADNSCDDGSRYDSNQDKCVACGRAGQTLCYKGKHVSSAEGVYCSEGTRYDSTQNKCTACGQAGQTFCYKGDHVSSAAGLYCNEGTRYDSSESQCVACGGEGQTFCYADPNGVSSQQGTKCNDGLRVQGSTCAK